MLQLSGSTNRFPPRGQQFMYWGRTHTYNWTGFSCHGMSRYIGDPTWYDHWLCRPSVGASLGFAPTMWKADGFIALQWALHYASRRWCGKLTWSHITCLPWFHSDPCRSSSSSQHSDRLEPRSCCWGGGGALWRPCSFTPNDLTSPLGQLFASPLGGQGYVSQGCTHTYNWTGFSW